VLERGRHRALTGTGLRETESGANEEQDKTEPGPERKADASDHLAVRFGAAARRSPAAHCWFVPSLI
jgi:hypothetical protein